MSSLGSFSAGVWINVVSRRREGKGGRERDVGKMKKHQVLIYNLT